jgi:SAM-dependent methyltransferase
VLDGLESLPTRAALLIADYRQDLALVHHLGFGFHAAACAPGIVERLEPVRRRGGLVLEIGCGSGLLTKELVAAGHRVVATDASPAMLELARATAPGAEEVRILVLPDDPLPEADAVVGCGHVLNYLPDLGNIHRALEAIARALRPGGLLALDLCDLEWGRTRRDQDSLGRVGDDWAIVTRCSVPAPDRFVRDMTTFVRRDGRWARDDEHHENVLVDVEDLAERLGAWGVSARVEQAFGGEVLPAGLRIIVGERRLAT